MDKFELIYDDFYMNGKPISPVYVCERLNELTVENEKLKTENTAQSDAIDGLQDLLAHMDMEEMI